MLAETPLHAVVCPLTVDPPTEAQVTPFRLDFAPENASNPIKVVVRGIRDWKTEPDIKYEVRVGSCTSKDPRFHGIGYPQAPAVTEFQLVNEEVAFPQISSVEPVAVRPTGTLITVSGSLLTPDARVFVAGYVLADLDAYPFMNSTRQPSVEGSRYSSRRRVPKRWVWVNNTARNRVQPIEVASLAAKGVNYTGPSTTFHDPLYNATMCSIMAELNLLNPKSSFSANILDYDEQPNLELSDLVGFRWLKSASGAVSSSTFITPCVPSSEVLTMPMARLRRAPSSAHLHLHRAECLCISLWQATDGILVTVVLPDSRLRSPATIDVYQQSVDVPTASMAVYRPTTACLAPPNIVLLLDGECGPCPEGAECPGLCTAGLSRPLAVASDLCSCAVRVFRQRATLAEAWVLEWRRVVGLCQALQQSGEPLCRLGEWDGHMHAGLHC
jgi:hypothetical protein